MPGTYTQLVDYCCRNRIEPHRVHYVGRLRDLVGIPRERPVLLVGEWWRKGDLRDRAEEMGFTFIRMSADGKPVC
jgi:hypothetical protein